jgi:hypothetical protein
MGKSRIICFLKQARCKKFLISPVNNALRVSQTVSKQPHFAYCLARDKEFENLLGGFPDIPDLLSFDLVEILFHLFH